MAKRLSIKHRKSRRDQARAYAETVKSGATHPRHKVAVERSRKALLKKAYPMT